MNSENLKRLMRLAQKTGDALIITDPEGHEPVVLMGVDRYEAMVDAPFLAEDGGFSADDVGFEDTFEPAVETYAPEIMEDLASEMEETASEHPHPGFEGVIEPQENNDDEPPAEEQFYLEPIE